MGEIAAGVGLKLIGGAMEGKSNRQMVKAQTNAAERLTRLQLQAQKDMEREKWGRERELWQKAMGAYSGFSRAPTLAGKSQMHTPYTEVNSPGLGFNNAEGSGAPSQ